jgi:hypothetical protein
LSRDQDVGPSALLVGARYCKERRALLIVDPPAGWHTADDALRGMREWQFSTENALMYFPRLLAHDKLRGHFEEFAPCGAVAGMLARCDEASPVWMPPKGEAAVLRPGYRPTCLVAEDRRMRLAAVGVNTILAMRSAARIGVAARTLAAGTATTADWRFLAARRFALFILNSVEHGTRWLAGSPQNIAAVEAAAAQVRTFFEALPEPKGFFAGPEQDGGLHLLIAFAARTEPGIHGFRIVHSASGSKVLSVSPSRLDPAHFSPAEIEWVDNLAQSLSP